MIELPITNIENFSVVKFKSAEWNYIINQKIYEFLVPMEYEDSGDNKCRQMEHGVMYNVNGFDDVNPEGIRIICLEKPIKLNDKNMLFRVIK